MNSCYIYHSVSSFTPRAWFSASGYKDCSRPRQGGETVGFRWVFCHLQCRIFKLNNEGHSLTKKRFWVTLRVYWYSTMLLLVSLLCCCTRSETKRRRRWRSKTILNFLSYCDQNRRWRLNPSFYISTVPSESKIETNNYQNDISVSRTIDVGDLTSHNHLRTSSSDVFMFRYSAWCNRHSHQFFLLKRLLGWNNCVQGRSHIGEGAG